MIRTGRCSQAQCMRLPRRERRRIARRRTVKEQAEAFFLCERRRRRRIPSAMRERRTKGTRAANLKGGARRLPILVAAVAHGAR
jgi:hypothetical protein